MYLSNCTGWPLSEVQRYRTRDIIRGVSWQESRNLISKYYIQHFRASYTIKCIMYKSVLCISFIINTFSALVVILNQTARQ